MNESQKTLLKNRIILLKKRKLSKQQPIQFYPKNSSLNNITKLIPKNKSSILKNLITSSNTNTNSNLFNISIPQINTSLTQTPTNTKRTKVTTIHINSKNETNTNTLKTLSRIIAPSFPQIPISQQTHTNKSYCESPLNSKRDLLSSYSRNISTKHPKSVVSKYLHTDSSYKLPKPALLLYHSNKVFPFPNSPQISRQKSNEIRKQLLHKKKIEMDIMTYNLKRSTSKYFFRNKEIKYAIKYKDEYNDKVSHINLYHSYLNKKIRECLLKDLNAPKNPYIHDIFYKSLPNKINFIEDIYHVPLLKSNFLFKNGFERIIEPNFINREYKLSLNKARREKLFIENSIYEQLYYLPRYNYQPLAVTNVSLYVRSYLGFTKDAVDAISLTPENNNFLSKSTTRMIVITVLVWVSLGITIYIYVVDVRVVICV